jgi:glycopeptide antibiotics resistance protein
MVKHQKYIIIALALIVVSLLMTFDASVFYSERTAYLFDSNIQSFAHVIIFATFAAITKNIRLAIVFAISIESFQFFIESRSFEVLDLVANVSGCYISEKLFFNKNRIT